MAQERKRRAVEASILGQWDQGRARTAGTGGHFILHERILDAFLVAMQIKVCDNGPFGARTFVGVCWRVPS